VERKRASGLAWKHNWRFRPINAKHIWAKRAVALLKSAFFQMESLVFFDAMPQRARLFWVFF
jgi:hypothetical protein